MTKPTNYHSTVRKDHGYDSTSQPRNLYLDLLKRTLTNLIYLDVEMALYKDETYESRREVREHGKDWPHWAHTMIGMKRLDNIQECMETILEENIPGDFIECGVWRGGACIFMRGVLAAYGVRDRRVWLADSFEGLPPPNPEKYPHDKDDLLFEESYLAVSAGTVNKNFFQYGLLDDLILFTPGLFKDTLPHLRACKFAVLRLDGDMYESTMDILVNLYDTVSPGGFIIIDDWALHGCQHAVKDFRDERNITEKMIQIDWTGWYWRKNK